MRYLVLPVCLGQEQIDAIRNRFADDSVEIYIASETKDAFRKVLQKMRASPNPLTCVCCTEKHDSVEPRMKRLGINYNFIPLENTECTKGKDYHSKVDVDKLVETVNGL